MTAMTCDGASNMMGCKTGLVTCLQECYPEVEEIASKETETESEREMQSNREVYINGIFKIGNNAI